MTVDTSPLNLPPSVSPGIQFTIGCLLNDVVWAECGCPYCRRWAHCVPSVLIEPSEILSYYTWQEDPPEATPLPYLRLKAFRSQYLKLPSFLGAFGCLLTLSSSRASAQYCLCPSVSLSPHSYHIGESLLPSVRNYLRFVGAEKKVAEYGFTRKVRFLRCSVYESFLYPASPEGPLDLITTSTKHVSMTENILILSAWLTRWRHWLCRYRTRKQLLECGQSNSSYINISYRRASNRFAPSSTNFCWITLDPAVPLFSNKPRPSLSILNPEMIRSRFPYLGLWLRPEKDRLRWWSPQTPWC